VDGFEFSYVCSKVVGGVIEGSDDREMVVARAGVTL
jgi:hypothetical protein